MGYQLMALNNNNNNNDNDNSNNVNKDNNTGRSSITVSASSFQTSAYLQQHHLHPRTISPKIPQLSMATPTSQMSHENSPPLRRQSDGPSQSPRRSSILPPLDPTLYGNQNQQLPVRRSTEPTSNVITLPPLSSIAPTSVPSPRSRDNSFVSPSMMDPAAHQLQHQQQLQHHSMTQRPQPQPAYIHSQPQYVTQAYQVAPQSMAPPPPHHQPQVHPQLQYGPPVVSVAGPVPPAYVGYHAYGPYPPPQTHLQQAQSQQPPPPPPSQGMPVMYHYRDPAYPHRQMRASVSGPGPTVMQVATPGAPPVPYARLPQQQQQILYHSHPGMSFTNIDNTKKVPRRRTRTGCLTCRKRRIKCDERKPHCLNCEKSRKVCLGYEHPPFQNRNRKYGSVADGDSGNGNEDDNDDDRQEDEFKEKEVSEIKGEEREETKKVEVITSN